MQFIIAYRLFNLVSLKIIIYIFKLLLMEK